MLKALFFNSVIQSLFYNSNQNKNYLQSIFILKSFAVKDSNNPINSLSRTSACSLPRDQSCSPNDSIAPHRPLFSCDHTQLPIHWVPATQMGSTPFGRVLPHWQRPVLPVLPWQVTTILTFAAVPSFKSAFPLSLDQ